MVLVEVMLSRDSMSTLVCIQLLCLVPSGVAVLLEYPDTVWYKKLFLLYVFILNYSLYKFH